MNPAPSRWQESCHQYHIFFSDSQAAFGDYADDLPGGSLPLVATPEQVAAAVLELLRDEHPDDAGAGPEYEQKGPRSPDLLLPESA